MLAGFCSDTSSLGLLYQYQLCLRDASPAGVRDSKLASLLTLLLQQSAPFLQQNSELWFSLVVLPHPSVNQQ